MDMDSHTASDILAAILGVGREMAQQRLDSFSGGIIAELLEKEEVGVDGLGTFAVTHDNASRERTPDGTRFLPPRNRVTFDPRSPGDGDSLAVVTGRMGLQGDEARRLVVALAATFNRCRKDGVDLELRGLCTFSKKDAGVWQFNPNPAIDQLLNTAYDGLKAIAVPESAERPEGGTGSYLKIAVIACLAIMACFGGYVMLRDGLSGKMGSVFHPRAEKKVAADAGRSSAGANEAKQAPPAVAPAAAPSTAASGTPDSLVLAKDRFTVITGTFSTVEIARNEARRLVGLGHRVMIWPVHSGKKLYLRVITGDFESHESALDSLRKMPPGLSRQAYIQKANKDVVIYAEQSL